MENFPDKYQNHDNGDKWRPKIYNFPQDTWEIPENEETSEFLGFSSNLSERQKDSYCYAANSEALEKADVWLFCGHPERATPENVVVGGKEGKQQNLKNTNYSICKCLTEEKLNHEETCTCMHSCKCKERSTPSLGHLQGSIGTYSMASTLQLNDATTDLVNDEEQERQGRTESYTKPSVSNIRYGYVQPFGTKEDTGIPTPPAEDPDDSIQICGTDQAVTAARSEQSYDKTIGSALFSHQRNSKCEQTADHCNQHTSCLLDLDGNSDPPASDENLPFDGETAVVHDITFAHENGRNSVWSRGSYQPVSITCVPDGHSNRDQNLSCRLELRKTNKASLKERAFGQQLIYGTASGHIKDFLASLKNTGKQFHGVLRDPELHNSSFDGRFSAGNEHLKVLDKKISGKLVLCILPTEDHNREISFLIIERKNEHFREDELYFYLRFGGKLPMVPELLGVLEDDGFVKMLLRCSKDCDLLYNVLGKKDYKCKTLCLMDQMVRGIDELHRNGVTLGQIDARNILLIPSREQSSVSLIQLDMVAIKAKPEGDKNHDKQLDIKDRIHSPRTSDELEEIELYKTYDMHNIGLIFKDVMENEICQVRQEKLGNWNSQYMLADHMDEERRIIPLLKKACARNSGNSCYVKVMFIYKGQLVLTTCIKNGMMVPQLLKHENVKDTLKFFAINRFELMDEDGRTIETVTEDSIVIIRET